MREVPAPGMLDRPARHDNGTIVTGGRLVEMRGLEPLTPAMRTRCSPS
jgi:hypothetical protein